MTAASTFIWKQVTLFHEILLEPRPLRTQCPENVTACFKAQRNIVTYKCVLLFYMRNGQGSLCREKVCVYQVHILLRMLSKRVLPDLARTKSSFTASLFPQKPQGLPPT